MKAIILYIILSIVILNSCSKQPITDVNNDINENQQIDVYVSDETINDLIYHYGTYKHSNSSKIIEIKYPNLFVYNGKQYQIETISKYMFKIIDCDFTEMNYLRDDAWVLTLWNGRIYENLIFRKI